MRASFNRRNHSEYDGERIQGRGCLELHPDSAWEGWLLKMLHSRLKDADFLAKADQRGDNYFCLQIELRSREEARKETQTRTFPEDHDQEGD